MPWRAWRTQSAGPPRGTLAGLRFVRNQMGYRADPADFICPQPIPSGAGDAPVAAWTWNPVPGPVPPRGRSWEISMGCTRSA